MGFFESESKDEKNYRIKFQVALFISLIIAIQGLVMVFVNYFSNSPKMIPVAASYSICFFFVFIYTYFRKTLRFFYISSFIIIIYLEINFLLTGGTEGFGIIWILLIPLFSIYLYDATFFHLANFIFLLVLVLGMWSPLNKYCYDFKKSFEIRFPLVYFFAFFFSVFLKHRISQTEEELEKQSGTLSKEIAMAAAMQKTFLSRPPSFYEHWTIAQRNAPMAGVSGDFYDYYAENHTLKGVSIFDISGHGIASGMLTMQARTIIEYQFLNDYDSELDLWETVQTINDKFIEAKGAVPNYLTGVIVKLKDNKLEYVNAGHQPPILYKKATNSFELLKKDPKSVGAIGLNGITSIYISQYLEMESGDEIFLFTDGLTDCVNEKNESFGYERVLESFKKYIHSDIKEQIKLIQEEIDKFKGDAPANDDRTMLILKRD